MERKQRTKKRTGAESEPANPTASSQRKSRKRAAAKRKTAEEAQRATDETRVAKQRRMATNDDDENRAGEETVKCQAKKRSRLSASVDKDELVRRAVAHAAAAAVHFPNDDDDDDDNDVQGKPDIARDLKAELSVAAEQLDDLEEAPSATEKCARATLLQSPIPVIESKKLASSDEDEVDEGELEPKKRKKKKKKRRRRLSSQPS